MTTRDTHESVCFQSGRRRLDWGAKSQHRFHFQLAHFSLTLHCGKQSDALWETCSPPNLHFHYHPKQTFIYSQPSQKLLLHNNQPPERIRMLYCNVGLITDVLSLFKQIPFQMSRIIKNRIQKKTEGLQKTRPGTFCSFPNSGPQELSMF